MATRSKGLYARSVFGSVRAIPMYRDGRPVGVALRGHPVGTACRKVGINCVRPLQGSSKYDKD